tara:strand:- start:610 stop:876 length:267 start_codon:yes stop_codon:yes gene_type:complete
MRGITGFSTTDVSRISWVISLWPFALAMGLQNRPKNVCTAAEKQTLARNLISSKTELTFIRVCKILFLHVILTTFTYAKPNRCINKKG